ncbi:MAG TPA: F0F1 ATP synthase subunit A [Acidimicrobiia bacterium]|nr:F0F1 ATP synthase subunit A [Acidimicrobiia bacterium]HZQ78027.1 F0F1 ATP synthase subunit A [Acidimicrobiia bacterium]
MFLADVTEDLVDFKLIGGITARQVLLIFCAVFMIVLFTWMSRKVTSKPAKTGVVALLEVALVWVRDEIVYPWLGPERGRRYLPFLWTLFFFILFSNTFGLLPFPVYPGGHTDALVVATGDLAVTGGLAFIAFIVIQASGMKAHGFAKYWADLVPHGVPKFLFPVVWVIEFFGLFTKPFALTVRLFANMTAGHAILAILFSFMYGVAHANKGVIGIPTTIASFGFILFIMVFETLVALIQAYIFTVLTTIFTSLAVAEEH